MKVGARTISQWGGSTGTLSSYIPSLSTNPSPLLGGAASYNHINKQVHRSPLKYPSTKNAPLRGGGAGIPPHQPPVLAPPRRSFLISRLLERLR